MDYRTLSDKSIAGEPLSRAEAHAVLDAPDDRRLGLLDAAFQVRRTYFGRKVRLQMLQNAKSGACQEDCGYCSQSAVSTADIRKYGLLKKSHMVEGARRAAASKAIRYCIVISGRGPLDRELTEISEAVREIKGAVPVQVCCSLGLLTETDARLPGPPRDDPQRESGGLGDLFRWHRRHGRDERGFDRPGARAARGEAGLDPDELPAPGGGHADAGSKEPHAPAMPEDPLPVPVSAPADR